MAPTIQRPGQPSQPKRTAGQDERRTDLICRIKYCNTLPDIPFDPKFIAYPFEQTRFINYNPTSLERNYKYELLTEHDLGVTIDLINPDIYPTDPSDHQELDLADQKLLEEELHHAQNTKRSQKHLKGVSWMRRPDYISTEQTRYQPTTIENIETNLGVGVKKNLKGQADYDLYMDRDAQINAINKTFEDSAIPIEKHYSKAGVYPVEVMDVLPDSEMWKYPCAQVIFDSDPAPIGVPTPGQLEQMSQAMIRGVMDESGEQFVAYFLPTDATLEKRRTDFTKEVDYQDEEEYEYNMAREYNWNVKSKASKGYEENFFFLFRGDGVFYNELETRVRLSKRRLKAGQQVSNSKLVVKHRPLNKQEHKMQRYREKNLEPLQEEDEMSEEDEEEEEETLGGGQGNVRSRSGSRSRSKSSSRSRSKSKSKSRSRSRSVSRSVSRSKSRSVSRSKSRSASRSKSRSKSRSRSRSRSKSPEKSKSPAKSPVASARKSRSRTKSKSPRKSKSRSGSRSGSGTPARSKSGSKSPERSKSGSKSPARSKSGSKSPARSKSGSKSPARSTGSKTPASRAGSKSPASRAGSKSPASRAGSKSPASRASSKSSARSGSGSPARSRSGSKSPARSKSGSRSGSSSASD